MQFSVIVPTADRPAAIERLLRGLAAQEFARDRFEVVVVDDGGTPPVAARVAPFAGTLALRYVWQPRTGPAGARNRAIALARGQLLLILNDDAGVPPDLLARHAAAHASATGPRAWLGGFDLAPDCLGPVARGLLKFDQPFPFQQMKRVGPNPGRFFWTCNLSVPRASVVAVGGFDEGFLHPVCEDVELGWRLEQQGVHVHWLEGTPCLHHHELTARWFWRRQVLLGASIVQMWRKHGAREMFPWLWQSRCRGDVELLAQSLEHLARNDGRLLERLAGELDDRIAARPDEPVPALTGLLQRIDRGALHLGLLAGLRGWTAEQASGWLRNGAANKAVLAR